MTEALKQSIEKLYSVFAKYPPGKRIRACDCCFNDNDNDILHSKPLREIPATQFTAYMGATEITAGDQSDFKHFLPRILELASVFEHSHYGIETDFRQLGGANYHNWPEGERSAVENFLGAYWKYILNLPYDFGKELVVEDFLCAISLAGYDTRKLLEVWQNTQNPLGDKFLVDLRMSLTAAGKLPNHFWQKDNQTIVLDWLKEGIIIQRIKRILSEHPEFNEYGITI